MNNNAGLAIKNTKIFRVIVFKKSIQIINKNLYLNTLYLGAIGVS